MKNKIMNIFIKLTFLLFLLWYLHSFLITLMNIKSFIWPILITSVMQGDVVATPLLGIEWSQKEIFENLQHQKDSSRIITLSMGEQTEISHNTLAKISADVMMKCVVDDLGWNYSKEEIPWLTLLLQKFFEKYPIFRVQNNDLDILLDASHINLMEKELLPDFKSGFTWWTKLLVDFCDLFPWWLKALWSKIKKELLKKKWDDMQQIFIKDFWNLFKQLDTAICSQHVTLKGVTIGEYFEAILKAFPNPHLKTYVDSLDKKYLENSLSEL